MFDKIKSNIISFKERYKAWRKKEKEKALCNRYRDHATVGNRCIGFSLNWKESHPMCEECPEFYKNKTYIK